jgi:REP element-mobilizing transposase RayT
MPQSFASLHCHIIFSTKQRQPWIDAEWQPRLFEYVGGILRGHKCSLVAAGGVPDHVHLLISLGRETAVAEAVRLIKSNSSVWVHENFPSRLDFAWQTGYGAFAVSYSQIEAVKHYLARQLEHHRTKTFQEEFIELLQRHEIEYDLRYLWE